LSLVGWGVSLIPSVTSWIPSIIIWSIAFLWLVGALIYWFKSRHKHQKEKRLTKRGQTVDESKEKRQLKLDVGKLLLDGKEILVDLEKMNGQLDAAGAASAELKFEIWYKDVSKTLQNTDYDRLWFENKEGLDYRKAKKTDYVEACKYGLDRLEYIKQLMFDRGDSQK